MKVLLLAAIVFCVYLAQIQAYLTVERGREFLQTKPVSVGFDSDEDLLPIPTRPPSRSSGRPVTPRPQVSSHKK